MNDAMQEKSPLKPLNIAEHLKRTAIERPFARAVIYPASRDGNGRVGYTHLTYRQLDRESDKIAHALEKIGITRGIRTILMVRPSLDFFALSFALFKVGAIPVMVDPGMGIRRMLRCLEESRPAGFIGIPLAHIMRRVFPEIFQVRKIYGYRWTPLFLVRAYPETTSGNAMAVLPFGAYICK